MAPRGLATDGLITEGNLHLAGGTGNRHIEVGSIAGYLTSWLQPQDQRIVGPLRRLRTPVVIRSAPGRILVTERMATSCSTPMVTQDLANHGSD